MSDQEFGPDQPAADSKRGGLVPFHADSMPRLVRQGAMFYRIPAAPGLPPAIVVAGGAARTSVNGESDAGPSAEAAGQEGEARVPGLPGCHGELIQLGSRTILW